jgi:hypothetical protein
MSRVARRARRRAWSAARPCPRPLTSQARAHVGDGVWVDDLAHAVGSCSWGASEVRAAWGASSRSTGNHQAFSVASSDLSAVPPITDTEAALLSALIAPDTPAVDKTVGAMSARLGLSLTEVRRTLHSLEGRKPALVRQTFDEDLDIEVWAATPAAAKAMRD